ncbi:hypothetical protein ACIQZD_18995 [Peribacillus sp. NPDC096447]|uniref:hypothetical protein n=1 Tax=Peribacillus sp. NPDC096447 TaxID=3364394 RepID=UPI00382A1F9B
MNFFKLVNKMGFGMVSSWFPFKILNKTFIWNETTIGLNLHSCRLAENRLNACGEEAGQEVGGRERGFKYGPQNECSGSE